MRFLCAIRIVCWRVSVFYVAAVSAIPADGVPCGGRVLHGHLLALPLWCLQGGAWRFRSPAYPATVVPEGGLALFVARRPPPLAYFFSPIPPAPFPGGERGDFLFSYARGSAPCIPGIRPPAALTEPAMQVTGGGAFPRRCRLGGRWRHPAGGAVVLVACLPCHCGA